MQKQKYVKHLYTKNNIPLCGKSSIPDREGMCLDCVELAQEIARLKKLSS